MKKLLALAVVAGSIATAQAAPLWLNDGTSNDGTTFYYDANSLVYSTSARDSASMWVKNVNRDGSYDVNRFEAHCPSRMSRFLSAYSYTINNVQTKLISRPTEWSFAVPNSFNESFVDYICGTRR